MKLSTLGEFGFLEALGLFAADHFSPEHKKGWLGPGDDAATIPPFTGELLISTDLLLEDVHFRLSATDPHRLGFKALAVNVSDIAAMGGRPVAFTLAAALPAELELIWAQEFYAGLKEAASRFDCPLVGGDTSKSDKILLSVTIFGEAFTGEGGPILRSGARPGMELYVTGSPGESGLGLTALEAGRGAEGSFAHLVNRHLAPEPRLALALELGRNQLADALIDVSDGVLQDAGHICELSGVGLVIAADRVPLSEELVAAAKLLGVDPLKAALTGGEDYELLLAAAPEKVTALMEAAKRTGTPLTRIGMAVDGDSVEVVDQAGSKLEYGSGNNSGGGFDHFSGG